MVNIFLESGLNYCAFLPPPQAMSYFEPPLSYLKIEFT